MEESLKMKANGLAFPKPMFYIRVPANYDNTFKKNVTKYTKVTS